MYWSGLSAAANAAAAYQTSQTGYAVSHTPAAGTYTTQRAPSTYDANYQTATSHASASYPTPSTTYDYGYSAAAAARPPAAAAAQQTAAAAAAAAAVYDTSKTYYGQPAAAAAAATPYTAAAAADSHYQGGSIRQSTTVAAPKTSYAATGYSVSSAASQPTAYNTSYTQQSAAANKGAGPYMQQTAAAAQTAVAAGAGGAAGGGVKAQSNLWQTIKKGPIGGPNRHNNKAKAPPRQQQLHYCDVCKISCAGPLTYREHLEGQKHKKKEAAAKAGPVPTRLGASLRCELCDVTCTGADAYAAHIRGAKHQKVVKLHQKLGKPIPSADPVVVGLKGSSTSSTGATGTSTSTSAGAKAGSTSGTPKKDGSGATSGSSQDLKDELLELKEKEVEPVGQEYIEEIKGTEGDTAGKVISFNCKLCECRFNDPNAKEMHMKGRRHRLQYKKKVNPDLQVEVKPSMRQRKLYEEKLRRQQLREEVWRRREEERIYEEEERWYWEERRRAEEEEYAYAEWYRSGRYPMRGPPPPPPGPGPMMARMPYMPQMHPMMMRRPDSRDDRHVMAKHADIYPLEEELASIQKIVSNTEKALKLVSDYLAELDAPKDAKAKEEKKEPAPAAAKEKEKTGSSSPNESTTDASVKDAKKENNFGSADKKDDSPNRVLKGVMRVGILAKGLLLRGDDRVHLVVLCGDKPTRTLLDRVADALPQHLATIAPNEKYDVQRAVEDAAIHVLYESYTVVVTLTAPIMREQLLHPENSESQMAVSKDAPDVLDKEKCLEALASLRHAKWFQARATGLQGCVMVIRIMRDLCQRVPTWKVLNSWALELICEKVIASASQPLSPGDGIRRVFEAVSSGLLLPGSPGLVDPCEKDPIDAAAHLTNQEREEITASAQHALRLIAFLQIHAVLGMDPIPPPKFSRNNRFTRKRRRDNSVGEGGDSENEQDGGDGKKDKKEEGDAPMETEKSK